MDTSTPSATERPHVLIVTDDVDLSQFLSEGLVYGGFWTSVVASGIQTLEVFRLRTFDLVLIDAALGGMSAIEVIRRLRGDSRPGDKSAPRTDIPILVIAGSTSEMNEPEVSSSGANGVLFPPLELEDLIPSLHRTVAAWRLKNPGRPFADAVAAELRPEN